MGGGLMVLREIGGGELVVTDRVSRGTEENRLST